MKMSNHYNLKLNKMRNNKSSCRNFMFSVDVTDYDYQYQLNMVVTQNKWPGNNKMAAVY